MKFLSTPQAPPGAAWTLYEYDLTALDTGSISGGSVVVPEVGGGPSITLAAVNSANAADIVLAATVGLTIEQINGNLPGTAPGVAFALSGFGLDLTTDAVAIHIDADCAPLDTNYEGVFVGLFKADTAFADAHHLTGLLYSDAIVGYAARTGAPGTSSYYPAATDQHWLGLLLDGGTLRATRDAAEPADPYAGTSITAASTWTAESVAPNGTPGYRAANLKAMICGIGVGAEAGVPTVTVRTIQVWILAKDAA